MNISIFSTLKTLIAEQTREPLTIFWNVLGPIAVFIAMNFERLTQHTIDSPSIMMPYVSYIAVSMALYSFAIVLVVRREEGFFVSVTHEPVGVIRYLLLQLIAISIIHLAASALFLMLFALFVLPLEPVAAVSLLTRSYVVYLLLALAFSSVISLPVTIKSGYSTASIVLMSSLGAYLVSSRMENGGGVISYVNPLYFGEKFIAGGAAIEGVALAVVTCLLLAAVGGLFFKKQPVARRA